MAAQEKSPNGLDRFEPGVQAIPHHHRMIPLALGEKLAGEVMNNLNLIPGRDDSDLFNVMLGFVAGVANRQPGSLGDTATFYRRLAQRLNETAHQIEDAEAMFKGRDLIPAEPTGDRHVA